MANAQHLRTAANIIRNYGLAKNTYREEEQLDCAHCTMGAVLDAIAPVRAGGVISIYQGPAEEPLIEVAKTIEPGYKPESERFDYFDIIAAWNDAEERTADDVIEVLERTAERLEA